MDHRRAKLPGQGENKRATLFLNEKEVVRIIFINLEHEKTF